MRLPNLELRYPLRQLRNEMDRLVSGFVQQAGDGLNFLRGQPAINLWETPDNLLFECELPGVKSEQLDISVVGDELTLKIQQPDLQESGVTFHRRERPVGVFGRVVALPVPVEADRVEAKLRDGVLTVTLPKAESAKPRKIHVAGGA